MNRAALRVHTVNSDILSVLEPEVLINAASALSLTAVAVTDLNFIQSFHSVENHRTKAATSLKVIYGLELGGQMPITVLAKDTKGINALRLLCTDPTRRSAILEEYRSHLLLGCMPENSNADLTGYDYMLLSPQAEADENRRLYALSKELGIPAVAAEQCCYMKPEEQACLDIICEYTERTPDPRSSHLHSTEEMLAIFDHLGKEAAYEIVVTNSNKIAESIDQVKLTDPELPYFLIPDAYEKVSAMCHEQVRQLYGPEPPEEIMNRLIDERCVLGFNASMFLLCHKLAKYSQDLSGFSGFRGKIGSSFIAYLLGITDINPLPAHYYCKSCKHVEFTQADSGYDLPKKICPNCGSTLEGDGHNIPYETCMSLCGETDVDIDLNVPGHIREDVIRYLRDYLGEDRVAMAGIIGTYFSNAAKKMLRSYLARHPEAESKLPNNVLHMLTMVKKSDNLHPGGFMILPEGIQWADVTPLRAVTPIGGVNRATATECYDCSELLPKVDIYNDRYLDQVFKLHTLTGVKPDQIDFSDPKVYRVFKTCDTNGIGEFSNDVCKEVLLQLQDIHFSDLIKVCGMMHGTYVWLCNGEKLVHEHPFRELIGTREDIFLTLRSYGIDRKDAFMIMETARKGQLPWYNKYCSASRNIVKCIDTLKNSDVPQWYIDSMCKAFYIFPKAHATYFAKLSYIMAWFKVYYPEAFEQVTNG